MGLYVRSKQPEAQLRPAALLAVPTALATRSMKTEDSPEVARSSWTPGHGTYPRIATEPGLGRAPSDASALPTS